MQQELKVVNQDGRLLLTDGVKFYPFPSGGGGGTRKIINNIISGDGLTSEVTLLPSDILSLAQNIDTTPDGDFFVLVPAPTTVGQAIFATEISIRTTSGIPYVVSGNANIFQKKANAGGFAFNFLQPTLASLGLGISPDTYLTLLFPYPIPSDPTDKAIIVANQSLKIGRGLITAPSGGDKSMIITTKYRLISI